MNRRVTTSRRRFLAAGGIALAMPAFSILPVAKAAPANGAGRPYPFPVVAVVDRRLGCAEAFSARIRALGVTVLPFEAGDVGALWFQALDPALASDPALAIIGITAPAPLRCLEMMALDHRCATLVRIDHQLVGDRVEHRVRAPANASTGDLYGALVTMARAPLCVPYVERQVTAAGSELSANSVAWIISRPSRVAKNSVRL